MRRMLAIVIGLLILLGFVAGGVVLWLLRPANADALTQYLGQQIVAIANTYLVPDLAFERVDYDHPGTLTLSTVTLTAPDGTTVVDLETMVVELAEIPKRGEPVRIARVKLEQGTVSIIRDAETGEIRGLAPFVERGVTPEDESEIEESVRLSEVLVLENVEIEGVDLVIDAGDGAGPMRLDGFELSMDVAPGDEPGWYALDFTAGRAPGLELDVAGQLNLDTFTLAMDRVTGVVELSDATYGSLPGQLADPLRERDARGKLEIELSGELPLTNPLGGSVVADIVLTEFNFAAGAYRVPINRADLHAELNAGAVNPMTLAMTTLRGSGEVSGPVRLSAAGMPAELTWSLTSLDLEQFLETGGDSAPDLAGLLSGSGSITTSLRSPIKAISGSGELHLKDGRLLAVPGLTELAQVASVVGFGDAAEKNHTADATFTLSSEGVHLDSSEFVTTTLAARATGLVRFDSSLDLSVNAGPLEKVQDMLGGLGEAIGKLTDKLVTYRVKGTTAEPEVSVAPLGVGG
ncbi:MAG: AsmA-like C-terminal region-containing protein [Phycisphaerales bacterium]